MLSIIAIIRFVRRRWRAIWMPSIMSMIRLVTRGRWIILELSCISIIRFLTGGWEKVKKELLLLSITSIICFVAGEMKVLKFRHGDQQFCSMRMNINLNVYFQKLDSAGVRFAAMYHNRLWLQKWTMNNQDVERLNWSTAIPFSARRHDRLYLTKKKGKELHVGRLNGIAVICFAVGWSTSHRRIFGIESQLLPDSLLEEDRIYRLGRPERFTFWALCVRLSAAAQKCDNSVSLPWKRVYVQGKSDVYRAHREYPEGRFAFCRMCA